MSLTDLERSVLEATAEGDPWRTPRGHGSRVTSQALGRLVRKGLAKMDPESIGGWLVTETGRAVLGKREPT